MYFKNVELTTQEMEGNLSVGHVVCQDVKKYQESNRENTICKCIKLYIFLTNENNQSW